MNSKSVVLLLGIVFYIIGVISTNIFLDPLQKSFFFDPTIELVVISIGVFFLSSFFYGRISYILLLFAGLFLGGGFAERPSYVVFALMPLLLGLMGGYHMGDLAAQDLRGKKNFFDQKNSYMIYVALIIALSLIIGLIFGGELNQIFLEQF